MDALNNGRLDDARRWDDERHAARVREWRLKAQRAERRLLARREERLATVALLVAVTDVPDAG